MSDSTLQGHSPSSFRVLRVGVIGLGVRGMDALARNMAETYPAVGLEVAALSDQNPDRMVEAARTLTDHYRAVGKQIDPRLYRSGHELITDDELDLVVITTPTHTHRAYAVPAILSGKKVYCDKPLAQNVGDSRAIFEAETAAANPLMMGFTRRFEAPWIRASELLASGEIGDLRMIQARTVIPYHRYLTGWWRRREWSGGALNDKGSHIFDVFNWMSNSKAVTVSGVGGRSMIDPDPTAPERCQDCDRSCMYRRRTKDSGEAVAPDLMLVPGSARSQETDEVHVDDSCVFRPGADIYHNGSVRFTYANGVIANYLFSFFGPPAEDEETIELIGTDGRLLLTRGLGQISIATVDGVRNRTLDVRSEDFSDSHFGADKQLVRALRGFCNGDIPVVSAAAGLESTRMVAAGLESMDQDGVQVAMEDYTDEVS